MNNNSQSKLQYNVIIKPRGDGKLYRLIEELRKQNAKQTTTKKTS